MPKIIINNIPSDIQRQGFDAKVSALNKMPYLRGLEQITLSYLGGITNHGLKDEERKLFIRIPGENSELLIDRQAEFDTLEKLSEHGLYPAVIEAHTQGELAGYKIEYFIEGETLQFATFHLHQTSVLPTLKEFHDSRMQLMNEFNIFTRLTLMIETLQCNEINTVPYFKNGQLSSIPLEEIQHYVDELQNKMDRLFPYEIELSPCHNDITPTNFIKLKDPINGRVYQMIDWEYAAKNDKMYDVAMLVAMLGLSPEQQTQFVLNYFNSTDEEHYAEEIKRVRFYAPLIKLYYGVWAALQVAMRNESSSINELRSGWGPQSITVFLEQYESDDYQELLSQTNTLGMY